MDFEFISRFAPMYATAALLTIRIALVGIVLSFLFGLLFALVRYFRVPYLQKIIAAYVEISRNTPLLIQLFFLYFALPNLNIKLSAYACCIIGLTFLGASYMEETFRSALSSVSRSQIESAMCIGLKKSQIIRFVVLPQALSVSIPGFCANVMFLIKETSVFSIVAVADLMYVAKDLIGLYYKTDEALLMLAASYFILLLPITFLSYYTERRLRYAQFGTSK